MRTKINAKACATNHKVLANVFVPNNMSGYPQYAKMNAPMLPIVPIATGFIADIVSWPNANMLAPADIEGNLSCC